MYQSLDSGTSVCSPQICGLAGGVGLSFYDWYADLPPASPQIWGEQTDVPESSDWYNAGYLITWGSNVPLTRTPDAHFMAEVRYKGTKVVSIAPDYAESSMFADTWIPLKVGSDSCGTEAIWRRRDCCAMSATFWPSTRMRPS